jgi:hypothetical protein
MVEEFGVGEDEIPEQSMRLTGFLQDDLTVLDELVGRDDLEALRTERTSPPGERSGQGSD